MHIGSVRRYCLRGARPRCLEQTLESSLWHMFHDQLSSFALLLCLFVLKASCIRITRTLLPSCEVLRLKTASALACQQSTLFLPSPLSVTLPLQQHILDDDHFCSQLADLGCTVYVLDRAANGRAMQANAVTYETAICECLAHIRSAQISDDCTVVASELSALYMLNFLSRQKEGNGVIPGRMRLVLMDPPPLHAILSEAGRKRVLERFRPCWNSLTLLALPVQGVPVKVHSRRRRGRSAIADVPAQSPLPCASMHQGDHARQRLWEALDSGALSTAQVLGERMPAGAASVADGLGKGNFVVMSTAPPCAEVAQQLDMSCSDIKWNPPDALDHDRAGADVDISAGAAVKLDPDAEEGTDCLPGLPGAAQASALCATTEEVVAAQDRWGAAAVEEVAAMYGALPVVYLSPITPALGDALPVPVAAAAPLTAPAALSADVWSRAAVPMHKQIARVLSLLMGL